MFIISAAAFLGFGTANAQSEFTKVIEEFLAAEEYENVYKFQYSHYNENKVFDNEINNVNIQIYNSFVSYLLETEDNGDYTIYEESLDIVIFNVDGVANYSKNCFLEISFDGIEDVYEYELSTVGYELAVASSFNFIPISIIETELKNDLEVDVVPNITNIKFIDSKEIEIFSINQVIDPYPTSFFDPLQPFLESWEYFVSGEFIEDLKEQDLGTSEITDKVIEEEKRLTEALAELVENGDCKVTDFDNSIITGRQSYITKFTILISVILTVNIGLITFMIIRGRKKRSNSKIKS